MDAQELKATLLDLKSRLEDIKVNVFQIEDKKKRLEAVSYTHLTLPTTNSV